MLLLVDAGNTRVKWALAAPGEVTAGNWAASGNVDHEAVDQLGQQWQGAGVNAVLVSNVAGTAMRAALEQQILVASTGLGVVDLTWFASKAAVAGVRNHYREPHLLGCDRLASMIGARTMRPGQALLVATCGTATTIDALTADGDFIGGLILPGLGTMAASLAQKAAQLPHISSLARLTELAGSNEPARFFADHTEEAIMRGCLAAQAGAIEQAAAVHANAHCILAGGAAAWILPCLHLDVTLVENLVLIGLHAVAIGHAGARSDVSGLPTPC